MRKCPNCGYEEAPIWRNRMYSLYTQYCKIDELEVWEPKIAKALKESTLFSQMGKQQVKFFSDGIYNYGLREDGTVIRIAKKDARHPESLKEPHKESPHKI